MPLQPAEERWHPTEIPNFDVAILHIVRDAVGEDVVYPYICHGDTMAFRLICRLVKV
ncbi:MAG: hypothetical protein QXI12_01130 [Candidatus Methanomethyliaceae archaeon]